MPKTTKTKEKKGWVALYGGEIIEWFGGDGSHVPMWLKKKNISNFAIWNKVHRPKIVPCTITYSLPKKITKKKS